MIASQYVNQRAAEMFGYSPKELVGRRAEILSISDRAYKDLAKKLLPLSRQIKLWSMNAKYDSVMAPHILGQVSAEVSKRHPEIRAIWIIKDVTEQLALQQRTTAGFAQVNSILNTAVMGLPSFAIGKLTDNRRLEELWL